MCFVLPRSTKWQCYDKKLYSEPLTGFSKNAHERLADHQNETRTIHQNTVPIYDSFMKIMKVKNVSYQRSS